MQASKRIRPCSARDHRPQHGLQNQRPRELRDSIYPPHDYVTSPEYVKNASIFLELVKEEMEEFYSPAKGRAAGAGGGKYKKEEYLSRFEYYLRCPESTTTSSSSSSRGGEGGGGGVGG